ncbi:MAG: hypothetical protein Q7U28_10675, partial [Aquabacterium sp.]|nr:hypothetical protein [Aquabacterium sp.]
MTHFLSRLMVWQKLLILGGLALILCGVPASMHLKNVSNDLAALELERKGATLVSAMTWLPKAMQAHRIFSAQVLRGKAEAESSRVAAQLEAKEQIEIIDRVLSSAIDKDITESWATVKSGWQNLSASVASQQIQADASTQVHSALIAKLIDLNESVGDAYGMTLDSDAGSYFLQSALVDEGLALAESMGQLRLIGNFVLQTKQLNDAHRGQIAGLLAAVAKSHSQVDSQLKKSFHVNAATKLALEGKLSESSKQINGLQALVNANLLAAKDLTYAPEAYFKQVTQAMDAQYVLIDEGYKVFQRVLDEREYAAKKAMYILIGSLLGMLAFALAAAVAIAKSISGPLNGAIAAAKLVQSGDLSRPIEAVGTDEPATLMHTLSAMQATLKDRNEVDAKKFAESERLRQALDVAETNVMVADDNYNIVYVNAALNTMLRTAESDLRKDLPRFDASTVIGTNIDTFHKNPAHQRGLLDRLTGG